MLKILSYIFMQYPFYKRPRDFSEFVAYSSKAEKERLLKRVADVAMRKQRELLRDTLSDL